MAESSTSVHNIETTGPPEDYPTYRAYRASTCGEELDATFELYSRVDKEEGKQRIDLLTNCRKFAWFSRNVETNKVSVISNSCRLRWCPICSRGRAGYIIHNLKPWIAGLVRPRFLTLTLKHSNAPLSDQISTIYKHFRMLRKHKWFRSRVAGGVWFFQIKLSSKADQWHPHIHCILHGKYLPHSELSKLWLRITGSSPVVDIRAVRDPEEAADYVARYSARPAQLRSYPIDLRVEIFCAMHRRRLCGSWGSARSVSLSPPARVESDRFVRLGSWTQIMFRKSVDPDAREIYRCWMLQKELARDITLDYVDRELDELPDIKFTESDEYVSPQFDFQ
jgi:hypothetical protein